MPAIQLSVAERKAHRAEAHHLDPVVMIGNDGLTPAVSAEIDRNLIAHGLIKIRVTGDDRDARAAILDRVCNELEAAPVQHIGKILVVYRPKPTKEDKKPARPAARGKRKPPRTPKRAFQNRE